MEQEQEQENFGLIETKDGGVLYVVKRGDRLVAGTGYNLGILVSDSLQIDEDFSLDKNSQEFYEILADKYGLREDSSDNDSDDIID